jgi:hypothetical protein
MKYLVLAVVFAAGYAAAHFGGLTAAADPPAPPPPPANPSIDMPGFLTVAQQAAAHREKRRVGEDDFIRMSKEEGTVVLDARSKRMYDLLHVKGAVNLPFPDIDAVSLPKRFPDKTARILIYCNNNFTPAPDRPDPAQAKRDPKVVEAFAPKASVASLNIPTFIALYSYGYRNVYELAPLIDPAKSKLTFESTPKR